MKNKHKRSLVLNADYSAIGLVGWQKAIQMDFKGLVKVIDFYKRDYIKCSSGMKWPCPAVVVLTKYKPKIKKKVPFSRKYIFIRDNLTCQYCGEQMHHSKLTFDHVIPRSKYKGKSPTHWTNIVTCCRRCNHKKGSHTLEQCGMKLQKEPKVPSPHIFVMGLAPWTILRKEWVPYIPKFYIDLLEQE